MTEKLPAVKARELVRVVEKLGFEFRRQRGSHAIYQAQRPESRCNSHAYWRLKRKTLRSIIEDLKITVEEFHALL